MPSVSRGASISPAQSTGKIGFWCFLGPSNTMNEGNIHVSSLLEIDIKLSNAVTFM